MLTLPLFLHVAVFCIGAIWVYHYCRDLPRHLKDWQDPRERVAILIVTGITAVLALWMLSSLKNWFL